ncbi:hypothetical protein BGU49_19905 [Clostridioides difficile]|nr:hypothetical protein BGU49_19905 [Clostridioides difficile]
MQAKDWICDEVRSRGLGYGYKSQGKAVVKSKSFANVKAEALNEDVYAVAEAIASLQENPIVDILKLDSTSLSK